MYVKCDQCGKKYKINKEKIPKKETRVKCKKCSSLIRIPPPTLNSYVKPAMGRGDVNISKKSKSSDHRKSRKTSPKQAHGVKDRMDSLVPRNTVTIILGGIVTLIALLSFYMWSNFFSLPQLTIMPFPDNATIRILNKEIFYKPGIKLEPGRYQVEVSSKGFVPKREWIDFDEASMVVPIELERQNDTPTGVREYFSRLLPQGLILGMSISEYSQTSYFAEGWTPGSDGVVSISPNQGEYSMFDEMVLQFHKNQLVNIRFSVRRNRTGESLFVKNTGPYKAFEMMNKKCNQVFGYEAIEENTSVTGCPYLRKQWKKTDYAAQMYYSDFDIPAACLYEKDGDLLFSIRMELEVFYFGYK